MLGQTSLTLLKSYVSIYSDVYVIIAKMELLIIVLEDLICMRAILTLFKKMTANWIN